MAKSSLTVFRRFAESTQIVTHHTALVRQLPCQGVPGVAVLAESMQEHDRSAGVLRLGCAAAPGHLGHQSGPLYFNDAGAIVHFARAYSWSTKQSVSVSGDSSRPDGAIAQMPPVIA